MRPLKSPNTVCSSRASANGVWCVGVALLAMSIACCPPAFGQAPPKALSQDMALVTRDGQEIKITYFKSTAGQDAPVVILLHGGGGNRLIWKSFAEQLQKVNFAVVTVDLRGHGESIGGAESTGKKPEAPKRGELAAMVNFDLEAVKKFLFDEHQNKQLNMNKLGIVASDVIAPVAIAYTELDWEKTPYDDGPTLSQRTPRGQDVQAIALLSPESGGTNKSLASIRNLRRAVLIVVGSKNSTDLKEARKMHDILAPKKEGFEQMFLEQYDSKLRGTDLLGKGLKTEVHLYNFLIKYVKDVKSDWRDRKSKLLD